MNVVAIIPARGGSKRIPGKNLLPLQGLPLIAYSVIHAKRASSVDGAVYVSTDDGRIADVARLHGAEVVHRPADLSGDEATSESALLHVLDDRRSRGMTDPDLVVFLQGTSPVRRPDDIDRAVAQLVGDGADSLFSACVNHRLIWAAAGAAGTPAPLNYDFRSRRREQAMETQYRENGSIYVFKPEILRKDNNRLGGRMSVFEMDYWSSFQIDTPEHVELIDWILARPEYRPAEPWPARVDLVVFDFDGVMTDNTVSVDSEGREAVRCHRGDGWGIARLREAGVPMLVLSTERDPVVASRCRKLNLECVQGVDDKAERLRAILRDRNLDPSRVAFVGNDVNDLGCMRAVGLPVAVADAHPEAAAHARLVLSRKGGQGAVREFCDLLLARLYPSGASER